MYMTAALPALLIAPVIASKRASRRFFALNSCQAPNKLAAATSTPPQAACGICISFTGATDAEQAQQTGEQVEHRNKQTYCCQYVIAFTAIHNATGFKQNQTGG